MPRLSMWFLGGHRVSLDQEPLRGLEYDKVRALLAYLALEAGRPHHREALADLLWPNLPERRARRNLSQALFSLRNALATTGGAGPSSPYLIVTAQSIQFSCDSDHWLDVSSFLSVHAACHEHPHWRLETCPACIDSPAQIEGRVRGGLRYLSADYRDLPPRQHSMRAVFDSAWALLSEAERAAFARLSLFCGPFTAEAAQAVASAGPGTLRALIHKSFLARGTGGRYEIRPLLRQYGEERLEERPAVAQDAGERHYRYYIAFAERNQGAIFCSDPRPAAREMEDIRAAWRWAVARDRLDALPMLTIGLHTLYGISQRYADGKADIARAAALLREREAEGSRGTALGVVLVSQAALAQATGATQHAARLLVEGLPLLRRLAAGQELACACHTAADDGPLQDDGTARALLLEGLAISRRLDLAWEEAQTLVSLAALEIRQGGYAEAERYRRQALALSQEHGFHRVTAFCLLGEGHMAYERGAYAEARPPLQAAQALFESASSQGVPLAQSLLGDIAFAEIKYEEAESHYRAVLSTYKQLGLVWVEPLAGDCLGTGPTLNRLGDVALAREDVEQAQARYKGALALAAQEPYLGLKLDALARQAVLLSREGHAERAAELAALVAAHPACINPT